MTPRTSLSVRQENKEDLETRNNTPKNNVSLYKDIIEDDKKYNENNKYKNDEEDDEDEDEDDKKEDSDSSLRDKDAEIKKKIKAFLSGETNAVIDANDDELNEIIEKMKKLNISKDKGVELQNIKNIKKTKIRGK